MRRRCQSPGSAAAPAGRGLAAPAPPPRLPPPQVRSVHTCQIPHKAGDDKSDAPWWSQWGRRGRERKSSSHKDVVSVQDAAERLAAGVDFMEVMIEHIRNHHLLNTETQDIKFKTN